MYDELVRNLRNEIKYALPSQTRKALIEAANAIKEQEIVIAGLNEAVKELVDDMPHWIPSEDCLPVNGEEVITLGPNGGMECGFYRGLCGTKRDKWEWKKHTVRTVKYWMPRKALPEPPKEET